MSGRTLEQKATVVFALGPTNTGKTHRAIERMLEHGSGMIGLPLRLLAREVYDRITARVGEELVALVTGEERRVPAHPAYWVCTVEAMPVTRRVDFLAVDEIQLAEHRERGHVFTERLLRARGELETWFLGSHSMAGIARELVPEASMESAYRLSRLRHAGPTSLRGLPPRSAVVAFSTSQVYELAERLRALRGGVAVVLGALSPRTRNAQVAMYQAGEVRYLVATDAIGMGLNLDVDHVAFAGLTKFDGFEQRSLTSAEVAQIAGRAGRHVRDGTFGTLKPLRPFSERLSAQIEQHRFAPVRALIYRNADLDYSSLQGLLGSLCAPPPRACLRRVEQADDFSVLKYLISLPEVRALASEPAAVSLLWEVCQVPNFRRQVESHHGALLTSLYRQLRVEGELSATWFEQQVRRLDHSSGDIPTLVGRLEGIRIWSYISQRRGWLHDPKPCQQMTQEVEDRLGDALHARLVERFVRKVGRAPRLRGSQAPGPVVSAHHGPFAELSRMLPQVPEDGESEEAFVARAEAASYGAFSLGPRFLIVFEGEAIARLTRGKDWVTPAVTLLEPDLWSAGGRRRLTRRLLAWLRDWVAVGGGGQPTLGSGALSPAGRGLAYMLQQGLGVLPRSAADPQVRALPHESRRRFTAAGLVVGHRHAYLRGALAAESMHIRAALAQLWSPIGGLQGEAGGLSWVSGDPFRQDDLAHKHGYDRLSASLAMRIDTIECLADYLEGPQGHARLRSALNALALPESAMKSTLNVLGLRSQDLRRARRRRRRRRKADAAVAQDEGEKG